MMQRRNCLTGLVIATVPFAGCGGLIGPEPEIVSVDADQSLTDALTGSVNFELEVVNRGRSGDIELEIIFEDGGGAVVGRERQVIFIDEGERRRESISVNVPDGTERYRAEAEAA